MDTLSVSFHTLSSLQATFRPDSATSRPHAALPLPWHPFYPTLVLVLVLVLILVTLWWYWTLGVCSSPFTHFPPFRPDSATFRPHSALPLPWQLAPLLSYPPLLVTMSWWYCVMIMKNHQSYKDPHLALFYMMQKRLWRDLKVKTFQLTQQLSRNSCTSLTKQLILKRNVPYKTFHMLPSKIASYFLWQLFSLGGWLGLTHAQLVCFNWKFLKMASLLNCWNL